MPSYLINSNDPCNTFGIPEKLIDITIANDPIVVPLLSYELSFKQHRILDPG
jgi:hypothetical protein